MMAQSENNDQDTPENKQKPQKRKQKDEENVETGKSEDDTPVSKKIFPSFSSQKCVKNVKTPKSKTSLKNSAVKKVTKKVKPKKKTAEMGNIDNSISDGTSKPAGVNIVMVDRETASLNPEQIGEEQSPMITNADPPTCKPLSKETDAIIVGQDDAISKNKDDRIGGSKDLNSSEIPKESSIVEAIVAQIPLLESDSKNPDSSSSSEMKQKSQNEDSEKCDSSNKKIVISNDTKLDEPFGESKAEGDNCKKSKDQIINDVQQNSSSQNDVKSNISSEVDTCQPVVKQYKLIQDQSDLTSVSESQNKNVEMIQVYKQNTVSNNEDQDETQPVIKQNTLIQDQSSQSSVSDSQSKNVEMIQVYKCKEYDVDHFQNSGQVKNSDNKHPDEEVVNSDDKSVDLVEVITKEKDVTPAPVESAILKDQLEKKEKKQSIVKSTKASGLNQAPKISGFTSGSIIKDSLIFENDDIDLTDSQLCATEWTPNGDSIPENGHSKKSDLAKFKRAEKEGTLIVNELITELSGLNKLLLHFKREIDAVWKKRRGSSVTNQQNVFKKRGPIQTLLGKFQ